MLPLTLGACTDGDPAPQADPTQPAADVPAGEALEPDFHARLFTFGSSITIGELPIGFRFGQARSPGPGNTELVGDDAGGPDQRTEVLSPSGSSIEEFQFWGPATDATGGLPSSLIVTVGPEGNADEAFLRRLAARTLRSSSGVEWFDMSPPDGSGDSSVARVLPGTLTLQLSGRGVSVDDLVAVGDSIEVEP